MIKEAEAGDFRSLLGEAGWEEDSDGRGVDEGCSNDNRGGGGGGGGDDNGACNSTSSSNVDDLELA